MRTLGVPHAPVAGTEYELEMNEPGEAGWELIQIAEADMSHTPVRVLRHPFAVFRRAREEAAPVGASQVQSPEAGMAFSTAAR